MGDMFEVNARQLAGMREYSAALIALNPERYLTGPYRVPPPAVRPQPMPARVPEPVAAEPNVSALDTAAGWLERELTPDGLMVTEVKERAHKAGIAPRTLRRAAERLRVVKAKQGVGGWLWTLAEEGEPTQHGRLPARRRKREMSA